MDLQAHIGKKPQELTPQCLSSKILGLPTSRLCNKQVALRREVFSMSIRRSEVWGDVAG